MVLGTTFADGFISKGSLRACKWDYSLKKNIKYGF